MSLIIKGNQSMIIGFINEEGKVSCKKEECIKALTKPRLPLFSVEDNEKLICSFCKAKLGAILEKEG